MSGSPVTISHSVMMEQTLDDTKLLRDLMKYVKSVVFHLYVGSNSIFEICISRILD